MMEFWYNVLHGVMIVIIGVVVLGFGWKIVALCRNASSARPDTIIVIACLTMLLLLIPHTILENKIYPAGQCPNCEHSVTSKFCEDCGWANDSYFERTDRK